MPKTTPKKPVTRLRSFLINSILVVFSTIFALLLVEVGLRLLGHSHKDIILSRGMILDPDCGFRLKPNSTLPAVPHVFPEVRVNSLGLRDQEYSKKKSADTTRILALGDSFTFGRVAYPYNYLTILEEKMNQQTHQKKVEILNAGVPAYQPVNELAYLKKFGLEFEPDLVILFFYVGNDLRSNELLPTEINPASEINIDEETYEEYFGYHWFSWSETYWTLLHIYLQNQLKAQIMSRIPEESRMKEIPPKVIHPEFAIMTVEEYDQTLETQMRNHLRPQSQNNWDRNNYKTTISVIKKMAEACGKKEIPFAVVLMPSEVQVDPEVKERFLQVAKNKIPAVHHDFEQPQKTLIKLLKDANLPVIDLLNPFISKGQNKRLYLLRDTHWNEAGNQLAAETIFPYLNEWVKNQK